MAVLADLASHGPASGRRKCLHGVVTRPTLSLSDMGPRGGFRFDDAAQFGIEFWRRLDAGHRCGLLRHSADCLAAVRHLRGDSKCLLASEHNFPAPAMVAGYTFKRTGNDTVGI